MESFKKYNILFILILFGYISRGQDPVNEIININKSFYDDMNIAMEVTTKYFIDNNVKATKETKTIIYKLPGCFLNKTSDFESMANKHYKINVNHNRKTIIIASVNNHSSSQNSQTVSNENENKSFKMALDTVLSYYKKVEVKKIDEKNNEIIFLFKKGIYESIKIIYDRKTYLVYNYLMKTSPTSNKSKDGKEHQYSYSITNKYLNKSLLSQKLFNENNYVIIKKQEVIPSMQFIGYKVVNNIKDNNTKK